jgi:hypothetical protein
MIDWTQGYTVSSNVLTIKKLGFNDVTSDLRGIEADGSLDGLSQHKQVNQMQLLNLMMIQILS